jgi:hypothetical protein
MSFKKYPIQTEESISDSIKTAGQAKESTLFPTKTAIWAIGRKISIQVKASTSTQMDRDIMESS